MNADRFRQLADRIDMIEKIINGHEEFTMALFLSREEDYIRYGETPPEDCKTAGCIAGWAYVLFCDPDDERHLNAGGVELGATNSLGLPGRRSADALFIARPPDNRMYPHQREFHWPGLGEITAAQAVSVLRNIAKWVDAHEGRPMDDLKVSNMISDFWFREFDKAHKEANSERR